jgi:hypothetical protein
MNQWTDAIPWIVAAVGWGATHLLSEARERRKEVRSQLDKVIERLSKIEENARSFHTALEFDQGKAASLLYEIDRLERSLTRIAKIDVETLIPVIVHHRRAITYKNFDRSSFTTQELGNELIGDINSDTQDFEDEIEAQYRRNYPSKFPYFRWTSGSKVGVSKSA